MTKTISIPIDPIILKQLSGKYGGAGYQIQKAMHTFCSERISVGERMLSASRDIRKKLVDPIGEPALLAVEKLLSVPFPRFYKFESKRELMLDLIAVLLTIVTTATTTKAVDNYFADDKTKIVQAVVAEINKNNKMRVEKTEALSMRNDLPMEKDLDLTRLELTQLAIDTDEELFLNEIKLGANGKALPEEHFRSFNRTKPAS